jgi:hypothetical protein
MISTNVRTTRTLKPQTRPMLYWTFADALVLAKRHLLQLVGMAKIVRGSSFERP